MTKQSGDDDAREEDPKKIPIRDFSDLRFLRTAYVRRGEKPIGVDSNGHPLPDEHEEDFGIRRSTADEALQFLRDSLSDADADDSLLEFLNDE
jgi:hypothetical protein